MEIKKFNKSNIKLLFYFLLTEVFLNKLFDDLFHLKVFIIIVTLFYLIMSYIKQKTNLIDSIILCKYILISITKYYSFKFIIFSFNSKLIYFLKGKSNKKSYIIIIILIIFHISINGTKIIKLYLNSLIKVVYMKTINIYHQVFSLRHDFQLNLYLLFIKSFLS